MKKIMVPVAVALVLGFGFIAQAAIVSPYRATDSDVVVPVTISSISIINTPTNLALGAALQKVVMQLSTGQDIVTTETKLQKQVADITSEQTELAAELATEQAQLAAVTLEVTPTK